MMARKWVNLMIYARLGTRWYTVCDTIDAVMVEGLQEKMDQVQWCVACDGAQPASTACIMTQREDWASDPYGEAFGLCDACEACCTAEELFQVVRTRFN
jgi:hypothetical protein